MSLDAEIRIHLLDKFRIPQVGVRVGSLRVEGQEQNHVRRVVRKMIAAGELTTRIARDAEGMPYSGAIVQSSARGLRVLSELLVNRQLQRICANA